MPASRFTVMWWLCPALLLSAVAEECHETGASFLQHGQHLHRSPVDPAVCEKSPYICAEPFDCLNISGQVKSPEQFQQQVAGPEGIDFHSWCYIPTFWEPAALPCLVEKDPLAYAQKMYENAMEKHIDGLHAANCFLVGYCESHEVTVNTTLAEAQDICDEWFPEPNGWRSMGSPPLVPLSQYTKQIAKQFAQYSCAIGTFQCDAIYCRKTYCQMEKYQKMFQAKWFDPTRTVDMMKRLILCAFPCTSENDHVVNSKSLSDAFFHMGLDYIKPRLMIHLCFKFTFIIIYHISFHPHRWFTVWFHHFCSTEGLHHGLLLGLRRPLRSRDARPAWRQLLEMFPGNM